MSSDVIVPEVGELGMEVTFVRWLKSAGDDIAVGDELFEVDTEKSVMVVEAYAAGTLVELTAREGDIIAPRDVIGRILAPGESFESRLTTPAADPHPLASPLSTPSSGGSPGAGDPSSSAPATGPGDSSPPGLATGTRRGGISPRARRVAAKLGVDIAGLEGSGPDGLITEGDVRAAAGQATTSTAKTPSVADASAPADSVDAAKLERARRAVAHLTTSSWQSIPHFYLELEADVEAALSVAKPTPLVCAAVAQALLRHPDCNLGWEGDRPVRRDGVDLGLLVDTPNGLLVAVIPDAHALDLVSTAEAIRDAAGRARSGKLGALDMRPRSLTISNLGMYSVDRFSAVIPTPDVMALAVGRTKTAAWWDGTAFVPRRTMDLTLSVDHRALDGAAAARLLSTLETILADPAGQGLA